MSGIDKVGKSIVKKLTLQDYKTEIQQNVNTEIPQDVNTEKDKKVKLTIYLTKEDAKKFNEICSKNLIKNGKMDKSALIAKAVNLLYEAENTRDHK
jgi:hypothetical protein